MQGHRARVIGVDEVVLVAYRHALNQCGRTVGSGSGVSGQGQCNRSLSYLQFEQTERVLEEPVRSSTSEVERTLKCS